MKALSLVVLFLGVISWGGCKKKEAVNPICLNEAKEILKKSDSTFFKGTISKAKLGDKTILLINNSENGWGTILDDLCNRLYTCCRDCDCTVPPWINQIKNKEVVWEVK